MNTPNRAPGGESGSARDGFEDLMKRLVDPQGSPEGRRGTDEALRRFVAAWEAKLLAEVHGRCGEEACVEMLVALRNRNLSAELRSIAGSADARGCLTRIESYWDADATAAQLDLEAEALRQRERETALTLRLEMRSGAPVTVGSWRVAPARGEDLRCISPRGTLLQVARTADAQVHRLRIRILPAAGGKHERLMDLTEGNGVSCLRSATSGDPLEVRAPTLEVALAVLVAAVEHTACPEQPLGSATTVEEGDGIVTPIDGKAVVEVMTRDKTAARATVIYGRGADEVRFDVRMARRRTAAVKLAAFGRPQRPLLEAAGLPASTPLTMVLGIALAALDQRFGEGIRWSR